MRRNLRNTSLAFKSLFFPILSISSNDQQRISVLTRLLSNELGGNCFTRVLLSLSPRPDPEVHAVLVHMASRMTKIVNCPIVNDQAALLLAARSRELCRQVAQAAAGTGTNTMNGTQTDQLERSTIHAIAYTNSVSDAAVIS